MSTSKHRIWTEQEDFFLKHSFGTLSLDLIARHLGRTESAVLRRHKTLGALNPKRRTWTEKEMTFLLKNIGRMRIPQIAEALGRSYLSVQTKSFKMFGGIYIGEHSPLTKYTDSDAELCRALFDEHIPIGVIAEKMEISEWHVKNIIDCKRRLRITPPYPARMRHDKSY